MKNTYKKPIIIIEEIEKTDVLLRSEQTDNNHVDAQEIINPNFSIKDILFTS